MRIVVVLLLTGGLGALAVGCGASATATRPISTGRGVECSFARSYSSLAQLRRQASSVAVITPTGDVNRHQVAGIPIDDATVRVLDVVSGPRLPPRIVLVDIADARIQGAAECAPAVAVGHTYLVYLARFRHRPGGPAQPGRYVVVGGPAGAFAHRGTPPPRDPNQRSFTRSEADAAASMPQRVSIADARADGV